MLLRTSRMLRSSFVPFRSRAIFVSLVVLALVSFSLPALAVPGLTLGTGGQNPARLPDSGRDASHYPNGVSFSDCMADTVFTFTVIAAAGTFTTGSDNVQAWAGVDDCSAQTARASSGTTSGKCQPVSDIVPIASSMQFKVRVRDLVYAARGNVSQSASGAAVATINKADASVCSAPADPARVPMTIVFVDFAASDASGKEAFALVYKPTSDGNQIVVDTVGPQVPTMLSLGIGDGQMQLNWLPPSNVVDTAGFKVFCDPSPGKDPALAPGPADGAAPQTCDGSAMSVDAAVPVDSATPADAAADVEAGSTGDASSTAVDSGSSSTCSTSDGGTNICTNSKVIVNGVNGSFIDSYYNCGPALSGSESKQATVTGLTNDVPYTFAVAATDLLGNVGPIAVFPCGTPAPIDDFWNKYKEAGGAAGGTFCALEEVGAPVPGTLAGLTLIVAAIALVRRRRDR